MSLNKASQPLLLIYLSCVKRSQALRSSHLALYSSQDQTRFGKSVDKEVRENRGGNNAMAGDVDKSQCKSQHPGRQGSADGCRQTTAEKSQYSMGQSEQQP